MGIILLTSLSLTALVLHLKSLRIKLKKYVRCCVWHWHWCLYFVLILTCGNQFWFHCFEKRRQLPYSFYYHHIHFRCFSYYFFIIVLLLKAKIYIVFYLFTRFPEVYCVRPVTANARADTPLNSFGIKATYTCDIGFEYSDNTTVKVFTCREDGWDPKPTPCLGKSARILIYSSFILPVDSYSI